MLIADIMHSCYGDNIGVATLLDSSSKNVVTAVEAYRGSEGTNLTLRDTQQLIIGEVMTSFS